MDNTLKNIVDLLQANKAELKADRIVLDKVITSISSIIDRFYSKESPYRERVKFLTQQISMFKLHKKDKIPIYNFTVESAMKEMIDLIDNINNEINLLGIPQNSSLKIDKSVNITNTMSQNQSQNQSIDVNVILDLLKNELTGKQYKEIEAIAQKEIEPKKALTKIIDKLKSFGEGVLASIVANIITNPNIWNGLIN
jgi:hypothetical protein